MYIPFSRYAEMGKVTDEVLELWEMYHELRFCQFMEWLQHELRAIGKDPFYVTDEELVKYCRELVKIYPKTFFSKA